MIFGFSILTTALLLSLVAAYYSVAGLTAIFSAAAIPVIIMGGSLELGKIAATVWLHNNWQRAGIMFKLYLIPAIVFLMVLTSMGIFGYLSKAHSDQSMVSGDSLSRVALYDEKIKISKENIDATRKALKQMDESVDQVMGRSTDEKGADKAVALRRSQQKERGRLFAEIEAEQKKVSAFHEQRAPLAAEFRKIEADVGPIKYIAALVYGENPDVNVLERAVRLVIIMIVLVFDPLALTLILAANKQFEWVRKGKGGWAHDEPPAYPSDNGPLTDQQIAQVKEATNEDLPTGPVITKNNLFSTNPQPIGWMFGEIPKVYPLSESEVEEVITEFDRARHAYLDKPFVHFENLKPMVAPTEPEPITESVIDYDPMGPNDSADMKAAKSVWKDLHPNDTLKMERIKLAKGLITELPWIKFIKNVPTSGFGNVFPMAAGKGDTYVRTDSLPNQLYKFNGNKWIEVDTHTTNSYTYDIAYLDYLIEKLSTGEYDPELLSAGEQEQVTQRLQDKTTDT